jgi:hypothetical protein
MGIDLTGKIEAGVGGLPNMEKVLALSVDTFVCGLIITPRSCFSVDSSPTC